MEQDLHSGGLNVSLTCNSSKTAALDFQDVEMSTICSIASKQEGITPIGTMT